MELEKFISSTLVSIASGIRLANDEVREYGASFADPVKAYDGQAPDSTIEFDILVDVSGGSKINVVDGASLGVGLMNIVRGDAGSKTVEETEERKLTANRVRFSIRARFSRLDSSS